MNVNDVNLVYNPDGGNQPAMHNIAVALEKAERHGITKLYAGMFKPEQERFILDYLRDKRNPFSIELWPLGSTRPVWENVKNNQAFRNFLRQAPGVGYVSPEDIASNDALLARYPGYIRMNPS